MLAGLFTRIPRHTFPRGCAILVCAGLALDCILVSFRMSILIADFKGASWQNSLVDAVTVVLPTLGEVFGSVATEKPTCCWCCLNPQHFGAEIVGLPGLNIRQPFFCRWKLSTLDLLHSYGSTDWCPRPGYLRISSKVFYIFSQSQRVHRWYKGIL